MGGSKEIIVRTIEVPPEPRKRKRRRPNKPEGFTFIDFDSTKDPSASLKQRRKEIRTLAAFACAGARKATLARRAESKTSSSDSSSTGSTSPTEQKSDLLIYQRYGPEQADSASEVLQRLNSFITQTQDGGQQRWSIPIERSALAHKAVRTILWNAICNNATLFQSAIFVSSTHSNTCGLPSDTFHLGVGVLLLRGASFEAVQAAVMMGAGTLTPVAIAMLAGWERKFGDQASYATHMLAWQSLQLPCDALYDSHVSTLVDVAFETFRDALAERTAISCTADLPPGLQLFKNDRSETKSLLDIARQIINNDPHAPDAIARGRAVGIENIAWNPSHTHSIHPNKAIEDSWDQIELNALYHLRAALVSISALQLAHSCEVQGKPWQWDWHNGIAVHTVSCQHLRTEPLLDTVFAELAVWSRFIMCATSRDPDRDNLVRAFLRHLKLETWQQLHGMLQKHMYNEQLFGKSCFDYFRLLMRPQVDNIL